MPCRYAGAAHVSGNRTQSPVILRNRHGHLFESRQVVWESSPVPPPHDQEITARDQNNSQNDQQRYRAGVASSGRPEHHPIAPQVWVNTPTAAGQQLLCLRLPDRRWNTPAAAERPAQPTIATGQRPESAATQTPPAKAGAGCRWGSAYGTLRGRECFCPGQRRAHRRSPRRCASEPARLRGHGRPSGTPGPTAVPVQQEPLVTEPADRLHEDRREPARRRAARWSATTRCGRRSGTPTAAMTIRSPAAIRAGPAPPLPTSSRRTTARPDPASALCCRPTECWTTTPTSFRWCRDQKRRDLLGARQLRPVLPGGSGLLSGYG